MQTFEATAMRNGPVPAHIIGGVRTLAPAEMRLLKAHLLRLDRESRHDRFNGAADDGFVTRYADHCVADGTVVVAYVEDGQVRAAAELHPAGDDAPEVAFSVERSYRRKGLGSILFTRLIDEARRRGFSALRVTTGSDNDAMRALARKFGATLTFRQGESTGLIDLERDPDTIEAADAPLAPAMVAAWTMPLDVARASLRANTAWWASLMQLYGQRPSSRS